MFIQQGGRARGGGTAPASARMLMQHCLCKHAEIWCRTAPANMLKPCVALTANQRSLIKGASKGHIHQAMEQRAPRPGFAPLSAPLAPKVEEVGDESDIRSTGINHTQAWLKRWVMLEWCWGYRHEVGDRGMLRSTEVEGCEDLRKLMLGSTEFEDQSRRSTARWRVLKLGRQVGEALQATLKNWRSQTLTI
eukprot:1159524-Pelagomonas_calceolata.AAC.8